MLTSWHFWIVYREKKRKISGCDYSLSPFSRSSPFLCHSHFFFLLSPCLWSYPISLHSFLYLFNFLSFSISLSDVPIQMCINRQLSFALNNQTIAFNTLVITIRFVFKSSSFLRLSHNMVRVKNWFIEWPLDISKLKETHY